MTVETIVVLDVEWVFEGPDPEVGIFGDLILHPCEANVDEEEASSDVTHRTDPGGATVTTSTTYTCPACQAAVTCIEQSPADWFAEPGRA